jgi:hypothetical protein
MKVKKYPPTRDRRDIGQVISPIEKLMAARQASSSCVGVEALLETDSKQIVTDNADPVSMRKTFRGRR